VNNITISFGRKVLQTESVEAALGLERLADLSSRFDVVDALVCELLIRSFRGERVVEMTTGKDQEPSLVVNGLRANYRAFVDGTFHLKNQQSRGAWFLPTETSLRPGIINFPANFQRTARFAGNLSWEEHCKASLESTADALLVWALLEPLFEALFEPFLLRGRLAGNKPREDQLKRWQAIDSLYQALGLEVAQELAVMRYGGGWQKLRSQEQVAAKQRLLAALVRQVRPIMAARYRAYCLRALLEHYYKKADAGGRARRKQALTKALERTISAYFGGDWLAFLDYIGEEPHPDEQIVTALPQTRLHVGGAKRAAEVAEQMGLPVTEVERMMAAYWQQTDSSSPVEQRVDALTCYWGVFDQIHARQATGMPPLWGLVEDHRPFDFYYHDPNLPYRPRLYLQLLPRDILTAVERLWGTTMLPRWPDRIISEPSPHMALAETMGPALKFWQGCALTAWFLCEGPSSRANMVGLEEYYRKEIKALEELGTPVDRRLFDELIQAEERLGPPQPLNQNSSTVTGTHAISIAFTTTSYGTRREGFERLRDIITRYRRSWAEEHLSRYLRLRWETEIRDAGRAYNLLLHETGKAPSPKRFASEAAPATNHWFGGDLSGLYGTLREKSPVQARLVAILPTDRVAFAFSVFQALGGNPSFRQERAYRPGQDYQAWRQEWDRQAQLSELAGLSFWYVQIEEGLGRAPDLKEFGRSKFTQLSTLMSDDVDQAWRIYTEAIAAAKQSGVSTIQVFNGPGRGADLQGERNLVASRQLPQIPAAGSQPSDHKRSWLDRLFNKKNGNL
jgi:hypothetical protein